RALCRDEFLHYLRVREWQDLVAQVHAALRSRPTTSARRTRDSDAVHRSVLAGLLSHIGMLEPREKSKDGAKERRRRRDYLGARGTRFAVWPGSVLAAAKEGPEWVMAAELVETSRLWGRMAAGIDPRWIEALAGDLARRSSSEPLWSRRSASAVVIERVTLYGLPIVAGRQVPLARTDPVAAREWFIRHALVHNDWRHGHPELQTNADLIADAREREERARQRDDVVDEDACFGFYAERLPESITSGRAFDSWWRRERRTQPHLLDLPADLVIDSTRLPSEEDYPPAWPAIPGVDASLPLTYCFAPGDERDGVTVQVPVDVLPALPANAFRWQVAGFREEVIVALLRALPKPVRRELGPAPQLAARLAAALSPDDADPSAAVRAETGVVIAPEAWDWDAVPAHLRVHVSVIDEAGREIGSGRDLADIKGRLQRQAADAVSRAMPELAAERVTTWPGLAPEATVERQGHAVTAYPSLVARGDGSAGVAVLATREEQQAAMPRGTARLLRISVPLRAASLRLTTQEKLALARNPQGSVHALLEECAETAALEIMAEAGGPPWSDEEYVGISEAFRATQVSRVQRLLAELVPVLGAWWETQARADEITTPALKPAVDDVREQVARLVYPGFVLDRGTAGLPHVRRYLDAAARRLQGLSSDAARDLLRMDQVQVLQQALHGVPMSARDTAPWRDILDGIEEFRVSLWAQDLGTRRKVSQKRLLEEIRALS
ncbi:MAG: DUF3418 domain-containing protein, partial [Candidatus Nanopelagicales bacterium]